MRRKASSSLSAANAEMKSKSNIWIETLLSFGVCGLGRGYTDLQASLATATFITVLRTGRFYFKTLPSVLSFRLNDNNTDK